MRKKSKLIILIFGFLGIILSAGYVQAADFGVSAVSNGLGGTLSATDPRIMVGRIIQIALSFLGVIAVALVMYAGFLWTTSEGEEEKITRAKNILRSAVIGLVIILSSWGIATFILYRLADATGAAGGGNPLASRNPGLNGGAGAIGACSIESAYPANGQSDVPRNTSIMVTFKEEVENTGLCVDASKKACVCNRTDCNLINPDVVRLYKEDLGDACAGATCPAENANVTQASLAIASDNKTLVITPLAALGTPTGNTQYSLKLTDGLKKLDGSSMFSGCDSKNGQWNFTVNSKLDLVPPLVVPGGIFPLPDNAKDAMNLVTAAHPASARITVNYCPKIFSAARVASIAPATGSPEATVSLDYHGPLSHFRVIIPAGSVSKAQLFDGHNNPLGISDFDKSGLAVFKDYLTFKVSGQAEGNSWDIYTYPEQVADTLTLNDTVFTFAATGENNNIAVPAICDKTIEAQNIQAKLNGLEIEAAVSGPTVILTSKVPGAGGNNIPLETNDTVALSIAPFAGGSDFSRSSVEKDKKDRPMNSAIQVTFDEAVNPITVSGSSGEVAKYIRLVNADSSSHPAGGSCSVNSDCLSYKCDNGLCAGDYLSGKYSVSNAYRTVEFISDQECGMNGCGEKIYCLPANSHLSLQLSAANLKTCTTDADCLPYSPFSSCRPSQGDASRKTCQDTGAKNYPAADAAALDGIVDASINSLDGNRDTLSSGPVSFYDDNYSPTALENTGKFDKYRFSFYVSDQIKLDPPQILSVTPGQGGNGTSLAEPLEIKFSTLMLNSTLRTGSVSIDNGKTVTEHKLVSLRGTSPVGYWISADNVDTEPVDGEPDQTIARIEHTPFAQSVSYKAQVGSGVKDIYQNCFKPSMGPDCAATPLAPSCCFGNPTAALGADGNCK